MTQRYVLALSFNLHRYKWPNKIFNEDLLRQCNQENIAMILIRRRWQWIGHH